MSIEIVGRVGWSTKFIVIESDTPVGAALQRARSAAAQWIVIRRYRGLYLYAFHPEELMLWPPLRAALDDGSADMNAPLENVLGLHEEHGSTKTESRAAPPPIDRSWRPNAQAPSIDRYVEVDAIGNPMAVGTMVLNPPRAARRLRPLRSARRRIFLGSKSVAVGSAPLSIDLEGDEGDTLYPSPAEGYSGVAEPEMPVLEGDPSYPSAMEGAPEVAAPEMPVLEDEGTTPVRHPSIDIDRPLLPGAEIHVVVDLLREAVEHTQGGPVDVGTLAADWTSLNLRVYLQCPALDLISTHSSATIKRNAASIPATFRAKVRNDSPRGAIAVLATFMLGTRFCGSAVRMFNIGSVSRGSAASDISKGLVAVEPKAAQPDLTVHISKLNKDKPDRLRWLVVTPHFDGLPAELEQDIELDNDPAAEASTLFKEFAVLERGQHTQRIEGFGSRLWTLAPAMFRTVYWALWDKYQRPLAIQFISDEPHMPWELMRPARPDESEVHPPLAIQHAVARWIKRWEGYMRNQLPAGRICTIAPKYTSAARALKRAQTESDRLVADFAARKEDGTRAAVLKLLETAPPSEPLAILHFAGHGKFAPEAATHSNIKLEDGDLAAAEVERPEVKLGRACRPLVFFNACEVGAAGAVFGDVGGWADAFLGRQFGGFIAPLWSVDDEDAGVVAAELLERIWKNHEPIGAALRDIRVEHGKVSPTFYSYLYYGDVTAQIAA